MSVATLDALKYTGISTQSTGLQRKRKLLRDKKKSEEKNPREATFGSRFSGSLRNRGFEQSIEIASCYYRWKVIGYIIGNNYLLATPADMMICR